jgi:signal transduction histidine kinase
MVHHLDNQPGMTEPLDQEMPVLAASTNPKIGWFTNRGGWAAFWRWLTNPIVAEPLDSFQRHKIRFLMAFLIFMIPALPIASAASFLARPQHGSLLADPGFLTAICCSALDTIAYILSRSKKTFPIAVAMMVPVGFVAPVIGVFLVPDQALIIYCYVTIGLSFASFLLPIGWVIILAIVSLALAAILPGLIPSLDMPAAGYLLAYLAFSSVMIVISAVVRERSYLQYMVQAKQLSRVAREAEEANRLKSELLATVSHELRTPLNAIIGFSELMLMGMGGSLDDRANHNARRIRDNGERLLELINNLIDISRMEAYRVELNQVSFKPSNLLHNVERIIETDALKKNLVYSSRFDPALPEIIVGDLRRLEQVLVNLVANAIKFTEKGEINVSLCRVDADNWSMVVSDTGIGIPVEAQHIIFEKFRQVDSSLSRGYEGAGLGLAIVSELVRAMEGHIRVDSIPGEGSTFTVTLPLVAGEKVEIV